MKQRAQKFFFIFLILMIAMSASAQRKKVMNLPKYDLDPYHFGFILAGNQMHYSLKMNEGFQLINYDASFWPEQPNSDSVALYSLNAVPTPGFTIGIVGNLRLGNHFDLRFIPSLSFGERHLDYKIKEYKDGAESFVSFRKSSASTFVEFPLHIKFRSKRLNNAAAYIIGGANYTMDLASQKKKEMDISNPDGTTSTIVEGVRTNRNDLALEIGTGFDFYTNFFKFGVELKMSYGLGNILSQDEYIYSSSIESMRNKVFQISFTFE
ncbi:MAG: porin family protein [Bacteroidetes bacterium]|nr:porin family protein [Bacteroidota bacterium]